MTDVKKQNVQPVPSAAARRSRIVVAGTGSGAGKTTVTLGLMKAFADSGLRVQGFKCGPDYIDPTYHTAATGTPSRNLDSWMTSADTVRETFIRASEGADLSVIEGVMGLYDGKDPLSNIGSTAEIAMLTDSPVLLVVDVRSMARSAAAIVLGFQRLEPKLCIAGVIVNRCGSQGHYSIVKKAIEQECGIPVLGWLKRDDGLDIPERHLGLVPAVERGELEPLFQRAAELIRAGTDLEALRALADSAPPLSLPAQPLFAADRLPSEGSQAATGERPIIAVAKDAAFNFYYPENLDLLRQSGAEIVYFSPLAGERIPQQAKGLYLGGGFPEEFAAAIAANTGFLEDIRHAVCRDMPIFAECGGYMVLARTLTDRAGSVHLMAGVIPSDVRMQEKRAALGYREATALQDCLLLEAGETIRGHEFHYSVMAYDESTVPYPYAYQAKGMRGLQSEGYAQGNLLAAYTHIHLASLPKAAARWVEKCRAYSQ
ncbi:cobyrinate a,c-diamide synthase [Paenibacillus brasilensis]|uniref:Cobyrinate a,c-diamide synthase n=1 Tax=Paenibacillus brasilensis TaxID=128574 RepID=A0ABU0KXL6_9BACL|nr:cobyrinate a,c-diamide synthase [Paenibacillus brasilensis]MDQ0494192.1 cobyrinic acid a,c-diamide synthase [Paenibacillus brasilensis]